MKDTFTNFMKCDIANLRLYHEVNWKKLVENKPKLRTCTNIFRTCTLFKWNLTKGDRSLMAQFRCGVLRLRVESGRFCNLQVDEKICEICNSGIEDEFDFLCKCSLYQNLRQNLYRSYSTLSNQFHQLLDI